MASARGPGVPGPRRPRGDRRLPEAQPRARGQPPDSVHGLGGNGPRAPVGHRGKPPRRRAAADRRPAHRGVGGGRPQPGVGDGTGDRSPREEEGVGVPLPGSGDTIRFTIRGTNPQEVEGVTDADGMLMYSYWDDNGAGTDEITACTTGLSKNVCTTSAVSWECPNGLFPNGVSCSRIPEI